MKRTNNRVGFSPDEWSGTCHHPDQPSWSESGREWLWLIEDDEEKVPDSTVSVSDSKQTIYLLDAGGNPIGEFDGEWELKPPAPQFADGPCFCGGMTENCPECDGSGWSDFARNVGG